jgi:hypothetical protein
VYGLGDTIDPALTRCGEDPCTPVDWVWRRDACQNYMQCADPRGWSTLAVKDGFIMGTVAAAGDEVSHGVPDVTSGGWLTIALIGVVAVAGLSVVTRFLNVR